jgi:hypothetical protein
MSDPMLVLTIAGATLLVLVCGVAFEAVRTFVRFVRWRREVRQTMQENEVLFTPLACAVIAMNEAEVDAFDATLEVGE